MSEQRFHIPKGARIRFLEPNHGINWRRWPTEEPQDWPDESKGSTLEVRPDRPAIEGVPEHVRQRYRG